METEEPVHDDAHTTRHMQEYLHDKNVKHGVERLDRRPASGATGNPKKHGHGGKFTWGGPVSEGADDEPAVFALDENDPNYVDEEQEARDAEAAVSVIEVPKVKGTEAVPTVVVNQKDY